MKKGYILVASGAACWGAVGTFSTILFQQGLSSLTVANFRILLTTLMLGLFLAIFNRQQFRINLKDIPFFAVAGLISVCLFNFTYITAINLTTIVTAVILLYTAPVFVTIISRFTFQEKITLQKAIALIFTLLGCFLVVEAYNLSNLKINLPGLLIGLSAGLTYGLYSIFGKKALASYSSWTTVFYSFAFGTAILSIFGQPWTKLYLFNDYQTAQFLFLNSLIPTVLAYTLYTAGLKYVESSKASIIATVEPVVAVILASLIFHETIRLYQFLGIILVLVSVILIQIPLKKRKKHEEPTDSVST
ncbi:MAG: EamA family transporter [Firmicutes bacterium]|nr:EamA family transporter [Bacillota bacterium]